MKEADVAIRIATMPPARQLLLAICLMRATTIGIAQEQVLQRDYGDAGDTYIEVQSLFGSAARHGALPFRVIIRNNSGRDRVWTVQFSEGYRGRKLRTESTFRFAVENGKQVQHEVVFQFGPSFAAYDYRDLNIVVTSPGLDSITRNAGAQTNQNFPFLAMSKPLAQRSLAALDDEVEKQKSNDYFFAKSFEPDDLPTDWLAYTALDFLLVDQKSWNNIRDVQRQAVLSWVRLGGNLDIYTASGGLFDELKLPDGLEFQERDQSARYSLGEIRIQKWNGSTLPTSLVSRYKSHITRTMELGSSYDSDWTLQNQLEEKDFDPLLTFILLLAFAIIVAPVNLFVFAKSGRRHRLFITTPIISLVACIVIVAFIFLKDGLGGRGLRAVFADLQSSPGEMRLYTTQEQISRTGVMLSSGFKSKKHLALDPVKLPDSAFNPLSQRSRRSNSYDFSGGSYSGGFFRSRSEQGFALQSAEPTRARVESVGATENSTGPELVSNLAFPVRDFFFVGEDDTYWRNEPDATVAPGSAIPLAQITKVELEKWYLNQTVGFSDPLKRKIRELSSVPGRFFAIPADSSDLAIPTHPSIDWDDRSVLLTGTVVAANPAADE